MGQLLAFSLLQAKWQVTLFDFKKGESCSEVAAGLLAPLSELEKNELTIYKMGVEALNEHWPKIMSYFKGKIYFQKRGSLILAHPRDHADLLHYIQRIAGKLGSHQFYKKVGQEEITALEPHISKFHQGYYFSDEGQVDSQNLLQALQGALIKQGVTWRSKSFVCALTPGKIHLKNKAYSFDLVFDCRGLSAKNVATALRGLRGEIIWLDAPDIKLTRPLRLMHPRYSVYLVPRPKGQYLIGASEIEATDFSPISLQTTLELLTAVYSINPRFSEARLIKTATQCRPAFADHLPKITYAEGLVSINGLYRHGYLIAPTLAAEIMRWLQGGSSKLTYKTLWEKAA